MKKQEQNSSINFSFSWTSKVTGRPQLLHCQAMSGGSAVVTVLPQVPEQRRKLVKIQNRVTRGAQASAGFCSNPLKSCLEDFI